MSYGPPPPGDPAGHDQSTGGYGPPAPQYGQPQAPYGDQSTGGYGPPAPQYGQPQAPYGQPMHHYGAPGPYGVPGPYGAQPPASDPPKNYLAFNILGIFGCLGMTSIIGIIGLIFALQVSSKWHIGDYVGAESAANTAKVLGIIGLCCFVVTALYLLSMGVLIVTSIAA
ncbi:CD225/dispanin family protein [Nocardiopsis sp. B62]|uniref:CD225/dispanin family protein n=1 Tax=Nocardiopsis sp. B62 TaxID=2824874 RepID=UPI001B39334E|nr:CD225/dispanin family protein [Nocardiopsis sp. B62]MBQ1083825.1 CD225/dispanin family protein [Nocardiopsis sp. B62]